MATRQDKAKEIVRQMKAQQHEATAARVFEVGDTIKDLSYYGQSKYLGSDSWWRVCMDDEGHSYQILRCGLLSEDEDGATFATFDGATFSSVSEKMNSIPLHTICHWDDYEGCVFPVPYPKDD